MLQLAEMPQGNLSSEKEKDQEDCVECKIFGQGICLQAFKEFDQCFDDATARGLGDEVCMDKFDAFRSCYARSTAAQEGLKATIKGL